MNKIYFFLICLCVFIFSPVKAQKVGLVLSGGGAKGLTHIGIIRALEENNIPIDYIAGTSMGAIIGSLYAMGYSPDDMEKLLKSDDFKRWYSGVIEEKYIYYFMKNPPTPEFINIRLSPEKLLHNEKPQILPSSVVDPIQMNLAFLELFGQATASCKENFDKLFIPFRCVASDVYNKKPIIFKNGDLGDAVRASMSFPAMFKPIEIDSVLAYDGGIYNNFPVNVMCDDFHPDVIIGSVVSSNPQKPKEGDIMGQLENMIMQKTDYSLPDSLGILMTFKYTDINLMDFDRYDELHNNGYNRTIQLMDSIKSRISRRINYRQLTLKRIAYKKRMPEFRFRKIYIQGANEQQQNYIRKEFHSEEQDVFYIEDVKKGYFRLLADNMISEIIPHAVYNASDHTFDLHLNVKMADELSLRIGGNVGSNGSNQIYIGATYHNMNNYSKEVSVDGQLGQIYNNVQIAGRLDMPTQLPTSFRLIASYSSFDYFKQEKLFTSGRTPVFNKKKEKFVKLLVSLPFLSRQKAEFGIGIADLKDNYFQTNVIDFGNAHDDESQYTIFGGSIALDGNTLNSRQFATAGRRERLVANIYTGTEHYKSGGDKIDPYEGQYKYVQSWLQLSYEMERYHQLSPKFVLGSYLYAYFSSRNFSHNYNATLMQAGEFAPTAHSKITYNEAFRANQFVGLGIMPVYQFNNVLQARAEAYAFAPIFPILQDDNAKAYYGEIFSRIEYMGELSFVVKLPFGAVSAYVNHYSSPRRNWNVGITLGWQIFNSRFIE